MAKRSRVASAAKPAILIACAGIAIGAAAFFVMRAMRRGNGPNGLLPEVDVRAYNEAFMSP